VLFSNRGGFMFTIERFMSDIGEKVCKIEDGEVAYNYFNSLGKTIIKDEFLFFDCLS